MARYYAQRAGAGLIVSEARSCRSRRGYPYTPASGRMPKSPAGGWSPTPCTRPAADRLSVVHCGRLSLPEFHGGELPVAFGDQSKLADVLWEGLKPTVTPAR